MKQFNYKSVMQVPKIVKVTLNMGLGEAVGDKKIVEHAVDDMAKIAGQKPIVTALRNARVAQQQLLPSVLRRPTCQHFDSAPPIRSHLPS